MAIVHQADTAGTVVAASTTSGTQSFVVLPSAGDTIVAMVVGIGTATQTPSFSCSDNQGNTYSVSKSVNNTNNGFVSVFVCPSIGSPSGTFTVTFNVGNSSLGKWGFICSRFSGLSATGQPDVTAVGTTGLSSSAAPGNMTTVTANTLVVGVGWLSIGTIAPPSSPWVQIAETNSGINPLGGAFYQIVSSTGTFNPSWSSSLTPNWAAAQLALKIAAVVKPLFRQSNLDGLSAGGGFFANPLGG